VLVVVVVCHQRSVTAGCHSWSPPVLAWQHTSSRLRHCRYVHIALLLSLWYPACDGTPGSSLRCCTAWVWYCLLAACVACGPGTVCAHTQPQLYHSSIRPPLRQNYVLLYNSTNHPCRRWCPSWMAWCLSVPSSSTWQSRWRHCRPPSTCCHTATGAIICTPLTSTCLSLAPYLAPLLSSLARSIAFVQGRDMCTTCSRLNDMRLRNTIECCC
jgi:hypothetical protein